MKHKPKVPNKEKIEEVFKELYKSDHKLGIEDNGPNGYTIHLGDGRAVHTNSAGVEQFNKAMTEQIKKMSEDIINEDKKKRR